MLSVKYWVLFPVVVLNIWSAGLSLGQDVGYLSLIPSTTKEVKPSMLCTTQAKYMYISHCYHNPLNFSWNQRDASLSIVLENEMKIAVYLWCVQLISWHDCQNMCNHGNIDNFKVIIHVFGCLCWQGGSEDISTSYYL